MSNPTNKPATAEELILQIAYEANQIPRGKTITADWFPEAKQQLRVAIKHILGPYGGSVPQQERLNEFLGDV